VQVFNCFQDAPLSAWGNKARESPLSAADTVSPRDADSPGDIFLCALGEGALTFVRSQAESLVKITGLQAGEG